MNDRLYKPWASAAAECYFGTEARDWGHLSPAAWFNEHRAELLPTIEAIMAARQPYRTGAGPDGEGVYFLFNDNGLVYVGQAKSISARLHRHDSASCWFTHFAAIWAPLALLNAVESYYLHSLRPALNERYNPPHHLVRDLVA